MGNTNIWFTDPLKSACLSDRAVLAKLGKHTTVPRAWVQKFRGKKGESGRLIGSVNSDFGIGCAQRESEPERKCPRMNARPGNCPISHANCLSLPSDTGPDKSLGLQPQCRIPRIARRMTRDANIGVISQISIASMTLERGVNGRFYMVRSMAGVAKSIMPAMSIPISLSNVIFQSGRRPLFATFSPCISAAQHAKAHPDKGSRVVGINHITAGVRARTFSFSPPESLVDMTLIA